MLRLTGTGYGVRGTVGSYRSSPVAVAVPLYPHRPFDAMTALGSFRRAAMGTS